MLIYPAIDIRGGKCVRLTQGDFGRETVYDEDPVEVAGRFEQAGAQWIHVVDLDAARTGESRNSEIVERIVASVKAKVQFGGGVRTLDAARKCFESGASRVVVGSALVQDEALSAAFFSEFGERIAAGIDVRNRKVSVSGWTEDSSLDVIDLARRVEDQGCRTIILTDISRDGSLSGPNLYLLNEVAGAVSCDLIASGGVSGLEDLVALKRISGVSGVIVGKALYEGQVDLADALVISKRSTAR